MLDSELKIGRLPLVRVVALPESDAQPEVIGVMARGGLDGVLLGADRLAHLFGLSPNGELIGVAPQVLFSSPLGGSSE